MKRLLMCIVRFFALFSAVSGEFSNSAISNASFSGVNRKAFGKLNHSPTNSLLQITPKQNIALVAAPDGTIYLVESNSRKILGSFMSGPSIYSSYQALPSKDSEHYNASDFFIDCGDDWGLYVHGPGCKKVKLPLSAEEFIKRMPIISADGGVMLGSKNTTVFLVNAKTGKVIYAMSSADHSAIGDQIAEEKQILLRKDVEEWVQSRAVYSEEVEQPLYVIRTDYALKYFSRKSGKDLWYLRFAEIEASFQCEETRSFFDDLPSNAEDIFGQKIKRDDELLLNCPTKVVVFRIRDQRMLEPFLVPDRLPSSQSEGWVPSLPAIFPLPLSTPLDSLPGDGQVLALPAVGAEYSGILSLRGPDVNEMHSTVAPEALAGSYMWYFIVFVVLLSFTVAFIFDLFPLAVGKKFKFNKVSEQGKLQTGIPRKKKARKSGINKNSTGMEASQKNISPGTIVGDTNVVLENPDIERTRKKPQLTFFNPVDTEIDGRKIGKLFITNKIIAKGSNGTVVLEGLYDGRPVAVKRLVKTHHDVALKEIQNLIASDCHPNIVRWYGVEYDLDFVYLSLERCACSLDDLIFSYSSAFQNPISNKDPDPNLFSGCTIGVKSVMEKTKDLELWKTNGHPSSQLLKLMRDIVSGLAHLHELGIIHRDLKPQNVLIIQERYLGAKLSDMGISKRLPGNMSALTLNATGCGTSGWQAPEQLRHGRQTRAVDLFGLGCILFFCLAGGQHPFGETFERDVNIVNSRKDLFLVENNPEAIDIITRLLDPDPDLRPRAVDVLHHPFFWNAEMRLSFLRDASDRVELEDREGESELLKALESIAPSALGGKWDEMMESAFIIDIGRYRRYKFDSVRDLLRVIRNKFNHHRELSQEIQGILGQVPQGFDSYFSSRFPQLLIEVYKVIHNFCREEESLQKYFGSNQI